MVSLVKDEKRDKKAETGRKSLFSIFLGVILYVPLALLFSALISTLIEWFGMFFEWWDLKGVSHSQQMVVQEIHFLNDRLDKNFLEVFSGLTVKEIFDATVGTFSEWMKYLGLWEFAVDKSSVGFGSYVGAAVNMIMLTFIRFIVFIFALPIYLIFAWVGISVGMVEREKRKAGGGRESGVIFNLAKRFVSPSIGIAMFIYLAYPDSIDPVFIIFPSACLFGYALAYMTASYKKYI